MWNLQDFHLFTFQLPWLFSRVFSPFWWHWLAHSLLQSQSSSLLGEHSAVFVPSVWLPSFALTSVQWIASNPFPSAAASVVMPTLGFVHCFCHKWCCNFCEMVRNLSEVCKKWEIITLMLFSAGFCCTCCSHFPGHHCFYFTYVSSKFLLFV